MALLPFRANSFTRGLSTKVSEPLRILFCGSDDFSIASLKALCEEHHNDLSSIESIDVVHRPAKRIGRGRQLIREGKYIQSN